MSYDYHFPSYWSRYLNMHQCYALRQLKESNNYWASMSRHSWHTSSRPKEPPMSDLQAIDMIRVLRDTPVEFYEAKVAVAECRYSASDVLRELYEQSLSHAQHTQESQDESDGPIRLRVDLALCRNPNTPTDVIQSIVERYPDDDVVSREIKNSLMHHPLSDSGTLERSACWSDPAHLDVLVRHPNTRSEILDRLSRREDTRNEAAAHPNLSVRRLEALSGEQYRNTGEVWFGVARNPTATAEMLHAVSSHEDPTLRFVVANRSDLLDETLIMLMLDEDVGVRSAATISYLKRQS